MMTPEQFCYWLQGRAELQPDNAPTLEEWKMIREHLETVFVKVTPPLQQFIPKSPTDASDYMPWIARCSAGVAIAETATLTTC